jgi:hypothetical protein
VYLHTDFVFLNQNLWNNISGSSAFDIACFFSKKNMLIVRIENILLDCLGFNSINLKLKTPLLSSKNLKNY